MILLDTSVLIAEDLAALSAEQEYAASILSRAELEFGIAVAKGATANARRHRLDRLDALFEWLPFTPTTTRAYGILARALHPTAPAQARRVDTYIAAHALELGVPLMTGNPADFRRLSRLITVVPFSP